MRRGPGNVRACLPRDDLSDVSERADRRPVAGLGREPGRGLHLGGHGPGRELMAGQLLGRHRVQPPLLRRAPVQVDAVHVGSHDEQVRAHVLGQQFAREILVDDRFDAQQVAWTRRGEHGGDAPAARADDHRSAVQQPADRLDLQDAPGLGRRHHPAPRVTILPERPALLGRQRIGGGLSVDRADELRGTGERRVLRIDHDHGEQGRHLLLRRQQAPQFLLDQVADHALGARVQHVQRVRLGAGVRLGLQRQQAHLRAVTVHDHDAVPGGQRRDRLRRDLDVPPLDLGGHRLAAPQQRVTAQRDHDPHRPGPVR
jgi:hypothetical protein